MGNRLLVPSVTPTPAAAGPTYVGVSAYKNADQSVNNATFTAITFQVESFDTDAFHDNSTNTSRFTIPTGKGGKYLISGIISYAFHATGTRLVAIYKNGSTWNYNAQLQTVTSSPSGIYIPVSFVINLAATDYVEIFAYQTSGGALNVAQDGTTATNIQVSYLGA